MRSPVAASSASSDEKARPGGGESQVGQSDGDRGNLRRHPPHFLLRAFLCPRAAARSGASGRNSRPTRSPAPGRWQYRSPPARGGRLRAALTLSYDSGRGNGPFGFGWSLSLPSVTRKTDKGLPRYDDAAESDVFVLSDAEDLVPARDPTATGPAARRSSHRHAPGYRVDRYRPRVEGPVRPHRAVDRDWPTATRTGGRSAGTTSRRSTARTPARRIADPHDPARIFSWLICRDLRRQGQRRRLRLRAEDGDGVDAAQAHERHRTAAARAANRYLKRIRYGNRPCPGWRPPDLRRSRSWLFEVVFDYGDHARRRRPTPAPDRAWPCRHDPFSSYRAGFEVRTYRLCQRVLMFHHFPDEEGVGARCLVRSTDLRVPRRGDAVGGVPRPRSPHIGHRRAAAPAT